MRKHQGLIYVHFEVFRPVALKVWSSDQQQKYHVVTFRNRNYWDSPGDPVAKTLCSQCRGTGSIPGRGARSHMLQLKILHTAMKTQNSQINK